MFLKPWALCEIFISDTNSVVFLHPGKLWVVCCQQRRVSLSKITQTQLLRSSYYNTNSPSLHSCAALLDLVTTSECWLLSNGKCYFYLPQLRLFQLVSRFNPEIMFTSFFLHPRAVISRCFPFTSYSKTDFSINLSVCLCVPSDADEGKRQNLTWLSITWNIRCSVNSQWLPVELQWF